MKKLLVTLVGVVALANFSLDCRSLVRISNSSENAIRFEVLGMPSELIPARSFHYMLRKPIDLSKSGNSEFNLGNKQFSLFFSADTKSFYLLNYVGKPLTYRLGGSKRTVAQGEVITHYPDVDIELSVDPYGTITMEYIPPRK